MLGAVQIGMTAAIIVVLVPMAMAGWHLSRNKMLFFSGALFITLAVGVHLTPFFPSSFLFSASSSAAAATSSPSAVVFDPRRHSCLSLLHDLTWSNVSFSSSSSLPSPSWSWSPSAAACKFQRLASRDAGDLLNGSWIVIAGDSQARLFALSLLSLLLPTPEALAAARSELSRRHSDYSAAVPEISARVDFVWAPYASNLTDLAASFSRQSPPDVAVLGAGLWHMLRVSDDSDYGESLHRLRAAAAAASLGGERSHSFWIGMPTLINSMLNTEEKREKMTDERRGAYDRQLWKSKLLKQSGGELTLLDIESLTWNCGLRCTDDGMHYHPAIYDAAVQIMLNALLIHSHQKL